MKITTLENTDMNRLCNLFNEAFSDYFLPMNLSQQQFESNMAGDSFDPLISVAAYVDNKPAGFIFHGAGLLNGIKTAYNCGTGVIPEQRGKKITGQLYDFILPQLRNQGFKKSVLEVITKNEKAIKIYSSIGFTIERELDCYKGKPGKETEKKDHVEIQPLESLDWPLLRSFRDWAPSWQNSDHAVENIKSELQAFGTFEKGELAAYMIFNTGRSRVIQFAVHPGHRRKGYGRALFEHAYKLSGTDLVCVNIDRSSAATSSFFESLGFSLLISQHEMQLTL